MASCIANPGTTASISVAHAAATTSSFVTTVTGSARITGSATVTTIAIPPRPHDSLFRLWVGKIRYVVLRVCASACVCVCACVRLCVCGVRVRVCARVCTFEKWLGQWERVPTPRNFPRYRPIGNIYDVLVFSHFLVPSQHVFLCWLMFGGLGINVVVL